MTRLALLAAMALLGISLLLAQNSQSTKPLSDQSNSSNASTQPQSSEPATPNKDQQSGAMPNHQQGKGDPAHQGLPDAAVHDEQNSTTSPTGAAGQNDTPSSSTMGTTGSTPAAAEPPQQQTAPQTATPPDQQPNSTQPDAPTPHAQLIQTPAARAVATHTPDPGTCMNPASLPAAADGTPAPPCR